MVEGGRGDGREEGRMVRRKRSRRRMRQNVFMAREGSDGEVSVAVSVAIRAKWRTALGPAFV